MDESLKIKISIKDLKELKSWTFDDIASVLFAEIPHRGKQTRRIH